jgi:hypothetical protein
MVGQQPANDRPDPTFYHRKSTGHTEIKDKEKTENGEIIRSASRGAGERAKRMRRTILSAEWAPHPAANISFD